MSDTKYQWSVFPKGDKGEQFVVREDSWTEFLTAMKNVRELMTGPVNGEPLPWENKQTNESTREPVSERDQELKEDVDDSLKNNELQYCPVHIADKVFWKDGKFGRFYSHGEKQPDGTWKNCVNGKDFK